MVKCKKLETLKKKKARALEIVSYVVAVPEQGCSPP